MPLKNIHTYLTHEELFGFKSSLKDVEQIIKSQVHIDLLLPILSQLASFRKGPFSSVFKNHFLKYVLSSVKHVDNDGSFSRSAEKTIKENALYSPQGILNVWKYVLVYGEQIPKTLLDRDIDRQYILSFLLCMNISDHLVDSSKSLICEIFQNYIFNRGTKFKTTLARTLKIYTSIARDKSRFHEKDFFDIDSEFKKNNGYSIEDYILVLFGVYTLFLIKQKSKNITADWYISIDQAFSTTDLAGIAKSVLHPLMFTLAEGKSELGASLISPWDSKYFIKKPIFNLMNDIVFPVSLPLLENAFADGLYWKIRNIYPRDEVKFQNFFGKPFELYIQDLLADSCLRSPLPYEVIFEFPYGKPEVMSPDVMVRFKNQLLAIEGKAQRIVYDKSVVEGNEESIEKDRIKMTVKPMEQLYSRVKELLEVPNDNCNLNGVDEVFLIVVNQGAFPTLPPIERRIEEDWAGLKGIKVPVNFYHMSIEEIEIICSLMERKKPIFRILRHKLHYPNNPFVNFISEQSVNIRNPQLLQKESDKLINWFSDHLL